MQCTHCGVKQVSTPFERKNSRFTLLFEGYAMFILADMPRAKAAEILRCNEKFLDAILTYWGGGNNEAVGRQDLTDVVRLAVDETSRRRGHDYVTVFIDADRRSVIDVEQGRTKSVISTFAEKLEEHGGAREAVSSVASVMPKSNLPGIDENFPNALNVIDKFHVKQVVTKRY